MTSRATAALEAIPPETAIFGRSDAMRAVRATLQKGASADVPMLFHGEGGCGKDVLARFVHEISPWHMGPFIKISCPTVRGEDEERDIFGSDGSGKVNVRVPRVRMAAGGTLFFDEVAELSASSQSRLLEFLQQYGHSDPDAEPRVLCAASRNLEEEAAGGRFRQDLLYRLNVISVRVPSLRERKADVPVLAEYFFREFSERYRSAAEPLSERLVEVLCAHAWPGNIRELENVIKRYVILGSADAIYGELDQKSDNGRKAPRFVTPEIGPDQPVALKEITRAAARDVEREVILKTLQANGWNRRRAARALKISYRALMYKMKGVEMNKLAPNGNGHRSDGR
ncbi:MAG: sigma 54-interacting transcriptional regulator [Terriglobales bacterium]